MRKIIDEVYKNRKVKSKTNYIKGLKLTLSNDGSYYVISGIKKTTITEIVIPSSYNNLPITSIGYQAFFRCSSLTSIIFEEGSKLTNIDNDAFFKCSSLTNIIIPNGMTRIGAFAFSGCSSLESIVIPNSVTNIGAFAFLCCSFLTNVYYKGTKEQWNSITIGIGNDSLTSATITYNYIFEE